MSEADLLVGWTTVSTIKEAQQLANGLIEARLAACVQVDGPIQSFYSWKGEIRTDKEVRLWIKYPARKDEAIQRLLNNLHPYAVPQWVSVPVERMSASYGKWVNDSCPDR